MSVGPKTKSGKYLEQHLHDFPDKEKIISFSFPRWKSCGWRDHRGKGVGFLMFSTYPNLFFGPQNGFCNIIESDRNSLNKKKRISYDSGMGGGGVPTHTLRFFQTKIRDLKYIRRSDYLIPGKNIWFLFPGENRVGVTLKLYPKYLGQEWKAPSFHNILEKIRANLQITLYCLKIRKEFFDRI